jgi:hypothetical protein
MAGSNRRLTLATIALPLLLLVFPRLARANDIFVNTLETESQPAPLCTLEDAVAAANTQMAVNGCGPGSGKDRIMFEVLGTIFTDDTLVIVDPVLHIIGPGLPCSGAGPCGITIDGGGTHQIFDTENSATNDLFEVQGLTLTDGFAPGASSGGGAIFANGTELEVNDCLLVNNKALGPTTPDFGGLGGAIFGKAGTVEIVNSTLANNTAVKSSPDGSEGGAIFSIGATLKITNTTISGNKEDFGAVVPKVASFKGTILANNANSNCIVNNPTDLGFNVEDDSSCNFNPAISKNNTDPKLDPDGVENNGGPTGTIALESGSPAIAFDKDCTDQESPKNTLHSDQRLYSRVNSPGSCSSGAYEFGALAPIVLVPKSERLQIVHSSSPQSDMVNTAFTFIDNGPPSPPNCDTGDDNALNGIEVGIVDGTCATASLNSGLFVILQFVPHVVNHQIYGTEFFFVPGPFGGNVSARIVQLPPPAGACGEWTLNLELSGLNLALDGLTNPGPGPFALIIVDGDGNEGCFDINNAIVGSQIPPPKHGVRRRVRR